MNGPSENYFVFLKSRGKKYVISLRSTKVAAAAATTTTKTESTTTIVTKNKNTTAAIAIYRILFK